MSASGHALGQSIRCSEPGTREYQEVGAEQSKYYVTPPNVSFHMRSKLASCSLHRR